MNTNPKLNHLTAERADGEPGESLLISADQFAAMMNVSTRTLWRLRSARKLIEPLKIGGSTRWRLAEVRRWIAAGCPPPNPQQ